MYIKVEWQSIPVVDSEKSLKIEEKEGTMVLIMTLYLTL